MARAFDTITEQMQAFVARQHMFFVATAPTGADGHVNLSPKGRDSFRVLGPNNVAYLDLTGSGAETIAHLRDNGRITFMFCAFEGKPDIVRFYGAGEVHLPDSERFEELRRHFGEHSAVRSIITAHIHRTSSSCGFAVPNMAYVDERLTLERFFENKSVEEVEDYWLEKNQRSIDELPALHGLDRSSSSNPLP